MSTPGHPNHRPTHTLPIELRRTTVPPAVRAWIARATGKSVARAERLPGASSTAVHRVRLSDGQSLVLRRYGWPGFLQDEPVAPQREVDALVFATAHDLPVPEVIAADVTGRDVGDNVPVILMTFLPGHALASPDPLRLAETAAAVHAIDPSEFGHRYLPWFEAGPFRPPVTAQRPRLWDRASEVRNDGAPRYRPAFIHRDFHPGNVLWRRNRCSGLVDWSNACRGPGGCDVATCHGNLIDWAGDQVADEFVAAYETITNEAQHPYWEIASVFEHGPSPWTPQQIVEDERRLERALVSLGRA